MTDAQPVKSLKLIRGSLRTACGAVKSQPGRLTMKGIVASHSATARSRSWSGNNVRRVGRNSPPRLDRRLEFGHEPTRDTAHSLSSRFGGFLHAPPREVSAPPVFATARRIWIDS